jgi:hypothetical protein
MPVINGRADTRTRRPAVAIGQDMGASAAFGSTVDDVWNFFDGLAYEIRAFDQWKSGIPSPSPGSRI